MSSKTQKGFFLLEALIAFSLASVLALGIMYFSDNGHRVISKVSVNNEISSALTRFRVGLTFPEICFDTLFSEQKNFSAIQVRDPKEVFAVKDLSEFIYLKKINYFLRDLSFLSATEGKDGGALYVANVFMGFETKEDRPSFRKRFLSTVLISVKSNQVNACASEGSLKVTFTSANPENALFNCKVFRKKLNILNSTSVSEIYSCEDIGPEYKDAVLISASCTGRGGLIPQKLDKNHARCYDRYREKTLQDHDNARVSLNCCHL